METSNIIFLFLAAIMVGAVGFILFSTNILRILFAFALVTIALAGIYVLLHAELVAVIQLMIYAGGIVVIMVFGIMLTKEISEKGITTGTHQIFPAILIFLIVMFGGGWMIYRSSLTWHEEAMPTNVVETTGKLFLTDHLLAFELVAFLLLVVLVGASFVAHKSKEAKK